MGAWKNDKNYGKGKFGIRWGILRDKDLFKNVNMVNWKVRAGEI